MTDLDLVIRAPRVVSTAGEVEEFTVVPVPVTVMVVPD